MATRTPTAELVLYQGAAFYTPKEVAAILRVSQWMVYRMMKSGRLGYVCFGERTNRIPGEAIELLIRQGLDHTPQMWSA